jgi:hypothetical protein
VIEKNRYPLSVIGYSLLVAPYWLRLPCCRFPVAGTLNAECGLRNGEKSGRNKKKLALRIRGWVLTYELSAINYEP